MFGDFFVVAYSFDIPLTLFCYPKLTTSQKLLAKELDN